MRDGPKNKALPWTNADDAVLREHYGTMPLRELRRRLFADRSIAGIRARANRLHVTRPRELWSTNELRLLKKHYSSLTCPELIKYHLPRRTEGAIYAKASLLGLVSYHFAIWSNREIDVMREHWGRLTAAEIRRRFLPNRTVAAIRLYASMHGMQVRRYTFPKADWTAKEDRWIRRHYLSLTGPQLHERYFPRRTVDAIQQRIRTLGLLRPRRTEAGLALIRREGTRPGGIARLCAHFGVCRRTIIADMKRMKLAPPSSAWTDAELETIRRLYPRHGRSLRIEGRTQAAVKCRATKLGLRVEPGIRPNSPRPPASGHARRPGK
jgi:hypothetical protein